MNYEYEWPGEENEYHFIYRGVRCLVLRHPKMGHLCGYVEVNKDHPWFDLSADAIDSMTDVHGGVTWFAELREKFGTGKWAGFDCAHSGDLVPCYKTILPGSVYRDYAYVSLEVEGLADQYIKADRTVTEKEYLNAIAKRKQLFLRPIIFGHQIREVQEVIDSYELKK